MHEDFIISIKGTRGFLLCCLLFFVSCKGGYVPLDSTEVSTKNRKQYYTAKKEMTTVPTPMGWDYEEDLRTIKPESKKTKAKKAKKIAWEKWPPRKQKQKLNISSWFNRRNKDKDKKSENEN